ncbi:MAG TPA: hypothetical protein VHC22_20160 [Pirellulales bacterium]|nr:hypothetical protein [Pirellulales bacterium]
MPRQFSLKTLLWLMVVVGAFFAGIRVEHERHDMERQGWVDSTMAQHELNLRLAKENRTLHRQLRDQPK